MFDSVDHFPHQYLYHRSLRNCLNKCQVEIDKVALQESIPLYLRARTLISDVGCEEDKRHLLGFITRTAHLESAEMEEKIKGEDCDTKHRLGLGRKYHGQIEQISAYHGEVEGNVEDPV